jgi:hypothetical protein
VLLESAKTDENGRANHDDCYLLKLRLRHASAPVPPKQAWLTITEHFGTLILLAIGTAYLKR